MTSRDVEPLLPLEHQKFVEIETNEMEYLLYAWFVWQDCSPVSSIRMYYVGMFVCGVFNFEYDYYYSRVNF